MRARGAIFFARDETLSVDREYIGVNFAAGNLHGLPELTEPETEAAVIAAIYGVTPICGEAATETVVTDALQRSRRIHITTHGQHAVSAPAFQCLFVTPDAQSDGVLHAYEILRLDCHRRAKTQQPKDMRTLGSTPQGQISPASQPPRCP